MIFKLAVVLLGGFYTFSAMANQIDCEEFPAMKEELKKSSPYYVEDIECISSKKPKIVRPKLKKVVKKKHKHSFPQKLSLEVITSLSSYNFKQTGELVESSIQNSGVINIGLNGNYRFRKSHAVSFELNYQQVEFNDEGEATKIPLFEYGVEYQYTFVHAGLNSKVLPTFHENDSSLIDQGSIRFYTLDLGASYQFNLPLESQLYLSGSYSVPVSSLNETGSFTVESPSGTGWIAETKISKKFMKIKKATVDLGVSFAIENREYQTEIQWNDDEGKVDQSLSLQKISFFIKGEF